MASPGSSIRSAARATFSAYRRVPVRWRLGGGSAALTFVILAGFASVTYILTHRQLNKSFQQQQYGAIQQMAGELKPTLQNGTVACQAQIYSFGSADQAQIRFFNLQGKLLCSSQLSGLNDPHF